MEETALIEKYLNGELSQAEIQAFELRLRSDPGFEETFLLYQQIEKEMKTAYANGLQGTLSTMGQQYFSSNEDKQAPVIKHTGRWRKIWSVAAAASVALFFAVRAFFLNPAATETVDELFATITKTDTLSFTSRGAGDSSKELIAEKYNQGNYAAAYPLLKDYCREQPLDMQMRLSYGIAASKAAKEAEALDILQQVADGNSVYRSKAIAYKALLLYHAGNKKEAVDMLKNILETDEGYAEAQKLIRKIE